MLSTEVDFSKVDSMLLFQAIIGVIGLEKAKEVLNHYYEVEEWKKTMHNSENRVYPQKIRDELYNVRGLLVSISLLIKDDEYKEYKYNPVESSIIIIEEKMDNIDKLLNELY